MTDLADEIDQKIAFHAAEIQRLLETRRYLAGRASAPAVGAVDPRDLVTLQKAAGILNLHPRTVERRIAKGLIPSHKISGYVFVPKSALPSPAVRKAPAAGDPA